MPWWLPFGRVPELSPAEVWQGVETRRFQIVDVRSELEFRKSRIAGAVHAPITSFAAEFRALSIDPARPVVTVCLSAHRSIPAVRLLREAGFAESYQLAGGMLAWWKAGLPTVGG